MVNVYKPQTPVLKSQINFKVADKELKFYNFSPTAEGTYIQTVDVDFILTNISCWLQSGDNSDKFHELYINNQLILKWNQQTTTTFDVSEGNKEIPFPQILIKKGTQLKLIATESGAQSLFCNYSFIGYYPQN